MKGNLTIDNGNTSVKVAFFIGSRRVATNRFARRDMRLLERFISTYKPDSAIVCSTASDDDSAAVERLVEQRCPRMLRLTHETPMPITLGYRTPQTLGRDRIATAVGAWDITRRQELTGDVLVIDAGTAITYDLVTADGCFVGGNIAPGLGLRFTALHEHTGKLPLVEPEGDTPLMGYDTLTAIRSGVVNGLVNEIKGCIDALKASSGSLEVFITGGDSQALLAHLGNERITHHEHLAAEGLNCIYLYNNANENN